MVFPLIYLNPQGTCKSNRLEMRIVFRNIYFKNILDLIRRKLVQHVFELLKINNFQNRSIFKFLEIERFRIGK